MAFPEDQVTIFHDYLAGGLTAALATARTELGRLRVSQAIPEPARFAALPLDPPLVGAERSRQERAIRVRAARITVLAAVNGAFAGDPAPPAAVALKEIGEAIRKQHDLAAMSGELAGFDRAFPALPDPKLTEAVLADAFTAEPIAFATIREVTVPGGGNQPQVPLTGTLAGRRIQRRGPDGTVPGCPASARLSGTEIGQLFALLDFLTDTPERRFRLGVLRGEVAAGLRDFTAALTVYSELINAEPADSVRRKFLGLRAGFAQLGIGDARFRSQRSPDTALRRLATGIYTCAKALPEQLGVSTRHPGRRRIERYADVQLAKLDAGMNFLGYSDSYVPILRPAALLEQADRRITAAADAARQFEDFQATANQIREQLAQLNFDRDIKQVEEQIVDKQIDTANDRERIASTSVQRIQTSIDALTTEALIGVAGGLLQAAASAALAGDPTGGVIGTSVPGIAGGVSGAASAVAGYHARKADLQFQKKIAEIERGIAQRDTAIARLERDIVDATIEFLGDKIRRITNGELNLDLYHAAAEAFRDIAQRHLDAAIYWSYLFERAVYFLRLPDDTAPRIDLDYLDRPGGLLAAPGRLRADLNDVSGLNVPITKPQFLTETYSLRALYPLEFGGLLQTGGMDFTLSLYELNKRRPGVYRQRIKRVEVVVQFPPPSGFSGRIRHRGPFLLRDKDSTPDPGQGSFLPSDEDLQRIYDELGAGATQGIPVGGVMPFLLDEDTIELSPDSPPPDLGDPDPAALMPIEGYGPAGDWSLEIENVDLRFVSDVLLRITYVIPESDGPLQGQVEQLIAQYEQQVLIPGDELDLISTVSLRQFPDALEQLRAGQTTLTMSRDDFPSGITDLLLKTVVIQALDAAQRGVPGIGLQIGRPGTTVQLDRTTRDDGFTEDVTAEIPTIPREQRVAVEGSYLLRLTGDPAALDPVDDLLLLFMYEYREV